MSEDHGGPHLTGHMVVRKSLPCCFSQTLPLSFMIRDVAELEPEPPTNVRSETDATHRSCAKRIQLHFPDEAEEILKRRCRFVRSVFLRCGFSQILFRYIFE
jgi:hypothetical protein